MMYDEKNPLDFELNSFWSAYRKACPGPDPSAGFMPEIWSRIDRRRDSSAPFIRRLTQTFAALAATASLALLLLSISLPHNTSLLSGSYVEALAQSQTTDASLLQDVAYLETSSDSSTQHFEDSQR